ncbi:TonB-dependent receptor domain-containing protein [Croceivirga sp. JEA036]|uniref:TonB-dependent receptor domain-containing protein n=1 Tax=Croceivirga sp. JEA036 TaxID=2721162 RepID=UPI001439D8A8|nr:TonB-dependent receptor [Croceivirga sp. JEA036]NJB35491.1 TonB-dependent receptor [Croceivirga sp. JEA036]
MKKLFLSLFILSSLLTQAQRPTNKSITLTGTVIDKDSGQPLEFATIVVQSVENPNSVTGGITDLDGKFNVAIDPGNYHIKFEYISYKSVTLNNQNITSSKDFGKIGLTLDVNQLEAVEVVGEKTTVEVRLDKKIYNVGKDLTNSGATITDALNNIPSVDVDVEGAISLRGNENVRILINGKPSALAGFGSSEALQQLPADAIEKVEVITSPSARYDAEGTAGILNIVLKREKTLGFNGSANVFIGHPTNSGATINGNLRTDKLNIFSTLGYRYRDAPGNAFYDNTYTSGSFDRIIEDREYNRLNKNFNANLGAEYFINDKSSLTTALFYRRSDGNDLTENTNQRFNLGAKENETFREEDEEEESDTYQVSINYVNKFNEDGHKLTADFQYSRDNQTTVSRIEENETLPNDALIALENVLEEETENEYLIQADYVLPMGDAQFEAGFRSTLKQEITDYQLDSLDQARNQFVINENLTNEFTYDENVHAVYTQYGDKFGKFSVLAGLRLEHTQLKGQVDTEFDPEALEQELGVDVDVNFDKKYLGLFPTLNLVYEITDTENVSIGYNRRINRPRGWFINPFPSRSSRTNIFQGNPDLDPAYSNAFDVGYLKRWKKVTLTTSVYYQRETNSFERVQESTGQTTTDGIEIVRSIPINLSTNNRYGAEASVMLNPAKWIRLTSSVNFFRFATEGSFNGVDYGAENNSFFTRLGSKVNLPAKISWQTNAFYFGPRQNAQTETEGIFSLNMAFSKDIFKDNATVSLNVSDLLNSRKRRSFTETEFFTSNSEFQWRRRQVTLSFLYRFNQSKNDRNNRQNNRGGDGDGEFEMEG